MDSSSRVLVAGAHGMVGSAIARNLADKGYKNIIKGVRYFVNFTDEKETKYFFQNSRPEYVFVAAAKVGGIMANNNYKAEFLTENLQIQINIIKHAHKYGVKKLLFLGSSCIYPKFATQPITEDQLMTGHLEPTNDAYAIAKIAGIMMCQAYRQQYGFNAISLMPTNLYGPNDNYDIETSHVLPGLIAKFHKAKVDNIPTVECWGDGTPMREFLHVDDLAEACYACMQEYDQPEPINVGTGKDISIKQLAEIIKEVVGYTGEIIWNTSKPNGAQRKVLNIDKILELGWEPKIKLWDGIQRTYKEFISNRF